MAIRVAPSILSADFGRLAEEVRAADEAGGDLIHVDVMDGHFVPNLTIGPVVVSAIRRATKKALDVHLMIEKPELSLVEYIRAGANAITVHPEASVHLHRTLHLIRSEGARAGVALNPHTPPELIDYVLGDIDLILVMSVNRPPPQSPRRRGRAVGWIGRRCSAGCTISTRFGAPAAAASASCQ